MQVQIPSVLSAISVVGAQLAAPVVADAGGVQVMTLDFGLVVQPQIVLVQAQWSATKDVTDGETDVTISQFDGTAIVEFQPNDDTLSYQLPLHPAGTLWFGQSFGVLTVVQGGTLVMEMTASSQGSDATLAQAVTAIRAMKFNR